MRVGSRELLPHRPPEAFDAGVDRQPGVIERDFAGEAVPVGVQPRRRQGHQHVARFDRGAVDEPVPLGDADAEAGEVELPVAVDAGHDRRLPAQQRRPGPHAALRHARHDGREPVRVVPVEGDVIQEEQRLRPQAEHVVHAHRRQIDADGVVFPRREGDLQLRADPVGAADQHGVGELGDVREPEQPRKPARQVHHPGPAGAPDEGRQLRHALRVTVQIDPGGLVGERFGHDAAASAVGGNPGGSGMPAAVKRSAAQAASAGASGGSGGRRYARRKNPFSANARATAAARSKFQRRVVLPERDRHRRQGVPQTERPNAHLGPIRRMTDRDAQLTPGVALHRQRGAGPQQVDFH